MPKKVKNRKGLSDSKGPSQYWKRLNLRDKALKGSVQIVPLLLDTVGSKQKVLCANTEGGRLAGNARRNFETDRGKPVISAQNYLDLKNGSDTEALPSDDEA